MCGYCGRRLEPVDGEAFECPRCGPLLRVLGAGLSWAGMVVAFARFQSEAVCSRGQLPLFADERYR